MSWGLFNKVKKGFKKVGSAFKKAAEFVNDKIVKPFKPVIKAAVNSYLPGAGIAVDAASAGIDALTKGDYNGAKYSANEVAKWAKNKFNNG